MRKKEVSPDDQIHTLVYIHGIANKPIEPSLKLEWDHALFGRGLGELSRMAHWANYGIHGAPVRSRFDPKGMFAAMGERPTSALAIEEDGIKSTSGLIEAVIREQSDSTSNLRPRPKRGADDLAHELLKEVAAMMPRKVPASMAAAGTYNSKYFDNNLNFKNPIVKALMKATMRDTYNFFFVRAEHDRMCGVLMSRMNSTHPMALLSHSLGTAIAYVVLQRAGTRVNVPVFVSFGSPLGMDSFKKAVRDHLGIRIGMPPCVKEWYNFANKFDPVAADQTLADDFAKAIIDDELSWFGGPVEAHMIEKYLGHKAVRSVLWPRLGVRFQQPLRDLVVVNDVSTEADFVGDDERVEVLVQLNTEADLKIGKKTSKSINDKRNWLFGALLEVHDPKGKATKLPDEFKYDPLDRVVSVSLTRPELERLRDIGLDHMVANDSEWLLRVWPNSRKSIQLEKSAIPIHVTAARNGYEAAGKRIAWAVLDTGVNRSHAHFSENKNIARIWNCTSAGAPQDATSGTGGHDTQGHGTHVAGIIAGQGVYEKKTKDGKIEEIDLLGMAPLAKLHIYKVLGDDGSGKDAWIIKALDHIYQVNSEAGKMLIHGINLSLGGPFNHLNYACGHSILCQELRRLWRQGVMVVVAAGNEGYEAVTEQGDVIVGPREASISDPANLNECIAVGSVHKENPHSYGISYYSSRGPTADGRRKPDCVAPGERIKSADANTGGYIDMSGTSMAAPHVSGMLAGFLSVRPEFIGQPDRVKEILLQSCTDLGRDPNYQGWGMPNVIKMLNQV